jgi:hypothetical protein
MYLREPFASSYRERHPRSEKLGAVILSPSCLIHMAGCFVYAADFLFFGFGLATLSHTRGGLSCLRKKMCERLDLVRAAPRARCFWQTWGNVKIWRTTSEVGRPFAIVTRHWQIQICWACCC